MKPISFIFCVALFILTSCGGNHSPSVIQSVISNESAAFCQDEDGKTHQVGERWLCPDGCNSCHCVEENGRVGIVSTLKACAPDVKEEAK